MELFEYSAQGKRPEHEDVHHVLRHPSGWWLCTVLDGHGGALAAHQAGALFPPLVWSALRAKRLASAPDAAWLARTRERLRRAVVRLDHHLFRASGFAKHKERDMDMDMDMDMDKVGGAGSGMRWTGRDDSGAALAAWIWHPDLRVGFALHVGDARVAHVRPDGGILFMTKDHSLDDARERARTKTFRGAIDRDRDRDEERDDAETEERDREEARVLSPVGGLTLAMTRSLGDFAFKIEPGSSYSAEHARVRAVADVRAFVFPRDAPLALDVVIACDGLWDVLATTPAERKRFRVPPARAARNPARALVRRALRAGTTDNVTAIVLRLRLDAGQRMAGASPEAHAVSAWEVRWRERCE
jgi:serine/threonine protein phosphatase PrpC